MALLSVSSSTPKPFEKIIPKEANPIQYGRLILESGEPGGSEFEVSGEELAALLALLDQFEYQAEGHADAIQNCVARLFLGDDPMQRVEWMLTSALRVLVNPLHTNRKAVTYTMLPRGEVETGEQLVSELLRIQK